MPHTMKNISAACTETKIDVETKELRLSSGQTAALLILFKLKILVKIVIVYPA